MAPCRQLLMWSVPSIAVLLGIFWFRKKREYAKSDPGGREKIKSLKEELAEALNVQAQADRISPLGKAERAIIKSTPIDIISNGVNSQRSSPLELTDEEVDLEIERIIRKKSIEKDKRMSAGFEKFCSMSLSSKEPANEPSIICSTVPTAISGFAKNTNLSPSKNKISDYIMNTQEMPSNSQAVVVQQDSTKVETSVFENNKNEDTKKVDAEDLNKNTDNIDDGNRDNNENDNIFSTAQNRRISERDSANHSPIDPLLASPSMCHFSDNHSEVKF